MNLVRGGTLTALAWLVATGCGGSGTDNLAGGGPPPGPGTGDGTQDGGEALPAPPSPVIGDPVSGIFVSATKGSDDNDATYLRPLKTLSRAMALATEKKTLPVYVCAETYNESVKLQDGIAIYGAYDCSGGKFTPSTARAKVLSPIEPGLLAEGLALPTRVEGFEFASPGVAAAPNSAMPAATSFGAIIRNSVSVSLANVRIAAGNGQDGLDGVESPEVNGFTTPSSAVGDFATGAAQHACITVNNNTACTFDLFAANTGGAAGGKGQCKFGGEGGPGGKGGTARIWAYDDYATNPGYDGALLYGQPPTASAVTAAGRTEGAAGARGAFGANGAWSFTESAGVVPGDGSVGGRGGPGQGGGGGNGALDFGFKIVAGAPMLKTPPHNTTWRTGYGGGGGAGGCGGAAGTAGRGGGGSVGLHVISSKVTLANTEIVAASGGRGGIGAAGNAGSAGAAGGPVQSGADPQYRTGEPGKPGGPGGKGGQSGHGAPGPSIALVYHGEKPTMTDVKLLFGSAGAAGPAVTDGAQSLPAPAQVAQAEYTY